MLTPQFHFANPQILAEARNEYREGVRRLAFCMAVLRMGLFFVVAPFWSSLSLFCRYMIQKFVQVQIRRGASCSMLCSD